MAYLDNVALRTDSDFLDRLSAACATAALAILTEATSTTLHAERLAWARKTVADPRGYAVEQTAWAVVSNATIAAKASAPATITDSEIFNAVTACLDGLVTPLTASAP